MITQFAVPQVDTPLEMFRAEHYGIAATMDQRDEVTLIKQEGAFLTDTLLEKARKTNALADVLLNEEYESLNSDTQQHLRWLMVDLTNEVCALAGLVGESHWTKNRLTSIKAADESKTAPLDPEVKSVKVVEVPPARDAYISELMRRATRQYLANAAAGGAKDDEDLDELLRRATAEYVAQGKLDG